MCNSKLYLEMYESNIGKLFKFDSYPKGIGYKKKIYGIYSLNSNMFGILGYKKEKTDFFHNKIVLLTKIEYEDKESKNYYKLTFLFKKQSYIIFHNDISILFMYFDKI